jgi:hypothetical protein
MANLERLLHVLKAGEEEPYLDMANWKKESNACGTIHCLFGAYVDKYNPEGFMFGSRHDSGTYPLKSGESYGYSSVLWGIAKHLEITYDEASFLFACQGGNVRNASTLTKEEAINRLRKFIIHKFIQQFEVPFFNRLQTVSLMARDNILDMATDFIEDFLRFTKKHA